MSQDPFEQMRRSNPMPPDQAPTAPMGVANTIVGSRASWPGWVIAAAAAVAVVVIGGGTLLLMNQTGSTVVAGSTTTSTTLFPLASTSPETTVTPTTGYPTTTLDSSYEFTAIVYLFADGVADTAQAGPYLIPVARPVTDRDVAAGTMLALLEGAPSDTSALSSAIPEGTTLRDARITDGIAIVDLSSEFLTGADYSAQERVLAQVVHSLSRLDGVEAVEVAIDGVPNSFEPRLEGGWVTMGPGMRSLRRSEFEHLLPAIMIEIPPYGGSTTNPLIATGTANVFEASVSLALTDSDGLIIWEGFTTATCGTGCLGEWAIEVPYSVDTAQMGSLIAWEEDARDGSQINVREHPVWLLPDDFVVSTTTTSIADSSTCSGSLVTDGLIDQSGLSAENAAMRAAIFDAAVACDWEMMRGLQDETFMYSFGGPGDAVAFWQELEAAGEQPIRFLAELLNRPYETQPGPESDYYVWPSVFATEWSAVSAADREALRPLYDDEDFAAFSGFGGYFGYRIGIVDGTWVYFLAGD